MSTWQILHGDVRERLKDLQPGSVQACVTSPPYFCLRDYGVEGQMGLERTPEAFIDALVGVFSDVRRVLADDGVLWLNIGDSYAASGRGGGGGSFQNNAIGREISEVNSFRMPPAGYKQKDLIGIPWMLAFALRRQRVEHVIEREADRAWLAALVDGEGTMTILRTMSPHGSGDSFPPVLQVRMCDVECITRSAEVTGFGVASPRQDPPSQGGVRGSYQWRLSGGKAAKVAADIYPHLCIKRKQAIVLWNHQRVRKSYETKKGQPIPRAAVEQQQVCRDLIRRLNRREPVDIPSWMAEPDVPTRPGWYLRSDVIWSKPNPMPESVTDRPTKAHEYLFLLTKSARYFYNAEAIAEPSIDPESLNGRNKRYDDQFVQADPNGYARTRVGFANIEPGKKYLTKNKRSVWTIPTRPWPFDGETSHRVPVSWDESDGDTTRITSPGCSVHGDRAVQAAKALCGGRAGDSLSHIGHNDSGPYASLPLDSVPIDLRPGDYSEGGTTDSSVPSHAPLATHHSSRTSRTGHAPATSQPYMPSAQTNDGNGDTPTARDFACSVARTLESSNAVDCVEDETVTVADGTPLRIGDKCSCEYYRTVTEEISHFATFPEALVEPCILAGSKEGDLILDPFTGSGTTGAVAIRLQRNFVGIELNGAYVELARKRIGNVAPLLAQEIA